MNTRRFAALAASTTLLTTLAACGGSAGPTYKDAVKDHSKATKACQSAFGSDQKKLALLDPGETSSSPKYKVTGEISGDDNNQLVCSIGAEDFHNAVTFSADPDNQAPGGMNAKSGKLYASAGPGSDSGTDFSADAQDVIKAATKKLAG